MTGKSLYEARSSGTGNALPRWHIAIVGAGSLGLLWAAKLSAYHDVTLIRKPPTPFRRTTFDYIPPSASGTIRVETTAGDANTVRQPCDALFLCTKSFDALPAIRQSAHLVRPGSPIVLMQNGLGSQDDVYQWLKRNRPDCPVLALVTTEGANRPTPVQVCHAGQGASWLGDYSPEVNESPCQDLANQLNRCGLTTYPVEDIQFYLWKKLFVNCGINPFTALLDCPNGEILSAEVFIRHIDDLAQELSRCATHFFAQDRPDSFCAEEIRAAIFQVAKATAKNISSMLQDVRLGRQTEIQYINGFITRYAKAHGISAPVNQMLTREVLNRHSG